MGLSNGKQPEAGELSPSQSGMVSPNERSEFTISRHPSSIFMEQVPTPGLRWQNGTDGSSTPQTGPHTGTNTTRTSRRNSFNGSMRSYASNSIMDDLKHEVMVNYTFQQQCGRLWLTDTSGDLEGVILRKSRGNYVSCPPALADSAFGYYCSILNLQVCIAAVAYEK